MKKIFIIFLFALILLPTVSWASTGGKAIQEWIEEGDSLYRQGEYDAAAGRYGLVLSANYASADLYYNLGNCYYRTNQMGLAILNYKRALRLQSTMTDARENLALAESKTVDKITPLPKLFIVRWINGLCNFFSPAVWRIVWLLLLAFVGIVVVVMRLGGGRALRKAAIIVGFFMLLLFAMATLLLLRATRHYNAHSEAVVMSQSIVVKSSPETQSTDKLILHEGAVVTIGDSLAGWYKITLADGTTGWCICTDMERI